MSSYKTIKTDLNNLYQYQYNYVDEVDPEDRVKQNHYNNYDINESRINYISNIIDDVNISRLTRTRRIDEILLMRAINARAEYLPNPLYKHFQNLIRLYLKKIINDYN